MRSAPMLTSTRVPVARTSFEDDLQKRGKNCFADSVPIAPQRDGVSGLSIFPPGTFGQMQFSFDATAEVAELLILSRWSVKADVSCLSFGVAIGVHGRMQGRNGRRTGDRSTSSTGSIVQLTFMRLSRNVRDYR